jgi:hypothetical protein
MDSKYSRLQNCANPSKPDPVNDKDQNERSSSKSLFQTNLNRLQGFFNKFSNFTTEGTLTSSDDLQTLLQKGDSDPILPSLV